MFHLALGTIILETMSYVDKSWLGQGSHFLDDLSCFPSIPVDYICPYPEKGQAVLVKVGH